MLKTTLANMRRIQRESAKPEFPVPPYFLTAGVFVNTTDDVAPPPVRFFFHTPRLAGLQTLLLQFEPHLVAHFRSRGEGNHAVLLTQQLSRAFVARHVWGLYLQAVRTAKNFLLSMAPLTIGWKSLMSASLINSLLHSNVLPSRWRLPNHAGFIAGVPLPRPLPGDVFCLPFTQVMVSGFGTIYLPCRGVVELGFVLRFTSQTASLQALLLPGLIMTICSCDAARSSRFPS